MKQIQQYDYDHLLVNLKMEATCAKDSMHINWVSEVRSNFTNFTCKCLCFGT